MFLSRKQINDSSMESKKNIVLIEDEDMVQQSIEENLQRNGYEVFSFSSAEAALNSESISNSDAIIMDIGLPGINGLEATELIKNNYEGTPVIMLTAYSEVDHRLQGFKTGADDYIIKPFFMEELLARLKTVLRRYEMVPGGKKIYKIADLEINAKSKTARRAETTIKFSLTEFNLLILLADADGYPVSKEEILKKIWKGRYTVGENTVEVYINLLRNKIDRNHGKKLIHTKPGFGYYLSET
jgi:two-component system, OmpR family, copper resistance phosphate regulon response regulator CusR